MRSRLITAVLAAFLFSGCTAGSHISDLGPTAMDDTVSVVSTARTHLAAGLTWLWQSYTRLKAAGVTVGSLQTAILDLEAAVKKQDLAAALDLYMKARGLVTALVAGVQS